MFSKHPAWVIAPVKEKERAVYCINNTQKWRPSKKQTQLTEFILSKYKNLLWFPEHIPRVFFCLNGVVQAITLPEAEDKKI